jgi:ABC-type Fe3+-hydroxamate transport system substrate-binding protein
MANESREERFRRIAARRTNSILKALRLLGNCSNRANYSYSDDQARRVFNAIEKQLADTKARFKGIGGQEFQL